MPPPRPSPATNSGFRTGSEAGKAGRVLLAVGRGLARSRIDARVARRAARAWSPANELQSNSKLPFRPLYQYAANGDSVSNVDSVSDHAKIRSGATLA